MGCSSSREQSHPQTNRPVDFQRVRNRPAERHTQTISAPSGGPVLVPPQQRDNQGRPIRPDERNLSGDQLHTALQYAAQYLHSKKASVSIVAVGGAVNTMLLQTRSATHDVDFIHQDSQSSEHYLLNEAAQYAISKSRVPLGRNWLNNQTILYIPRQLQASLVRTAVEQNEVVFQAPGLTVYAAPWSYALCSKLDRMTKDTRRPYDIQDATVYLRRYIQIHGNEAVSAGQLRRWTQQYGTQISDAVVRELTHAYSKKYRQSGITE